MSSYSSQDFGTHLRTTHGPVQANGKMWVYEICDYSSNIGDYGIARAWSFTGPSTPGDMPGAWTLVASSPQVNDGTFAGGGNIIIGSLYVDPSTGKCWATASIHNNPNGDNGGDPRNPYGTVAGDSTGVNDVFHGVLHVYLFNPADPLLGWVEQSTALHTHNIVFEDPFDYTAECYAHTVSCPGNTFSPGDILSYLTTPSLVAVTQPAICYKVSGDIVTFFVTDNTVTEYGGDLPPALSNDGITYINITDVTPPRNWMLIQVLGNNFSPGDLVRIQSTTGLLMDYDYNYYGGWAEVEEVFDSQYVSLFPNNKQLNRTAPDSRNPVGSGTIDVIGVSSGTIARYSDDGPGLYFVDAVSGPILVNTCDNPAPHAIASGQMANTGYNWFNKVIPRPNGDLVAVFMGEGGLTFATLNNSWADSTVIATNDSNGLPIFSAIDVYPDTLGGVYVVTGTGTPASISTQVSNFFCIRINPDNTFTKTTLPISTYIQNDPTNLSDGDFSAATDPCTSEPIDPIQCTAIGNILVAQGKVFITVRWVDKVPCLLIETEGDNTWSGAREEVPAYFGIPNIMTGYLVSPVTIQYINDPVNVTNGTNGIYIVFQLYVSIYGAESYPVYIYAIRTVTDTYTTSGEFTDTDSAAFAQVKNNQIFIGYDSVSDCEMFQSFGYNPSYTFEYVTPATPLAASCNTPPAGYIGVFYTHYLLATYGTPPYIWSLLSGSLPLGLSLSSSGVISGTPLVSGTFSFVVQVTDSLGNTASASCSTDTPPDNTMSITVGLGGLTCP